jgi:hypothetical protein
VNAPRERRTVDRSVGNKRHEAARSPLFRSIKRLFRLHVDPTWESFT